MFSFHFEGALPFGFTTRKRFFCGKPEVKQVLYAKLLESPLLLYPRCIVLFCIDETIICKKALFLVLKRTHYWSLRDLWEGYRKGFVSRIYTPTSHAALNNITIENCASVDRVNWSFKSHVMPVAKVSQGGCRLGVVFLFQGEKHCGRASEGLT